MIHVIAHRPGIVIMATLLVLLRPPPNPSNCIPFEKKHHLAEACSEEPLGSGEPSARNNTASRSAECLVRCFVVSISHLVPLEAAPKTTQTDPYWFLLDTVKPGSW